MSRAGKGSTPASEIKTFDAIVKLKVLNHEKSKKILKFDTRLCHVLSFHYDVKMVFFHFLTFQRTESSGHFDARLAKTSGSFKLVDFFEKVSFR